MMEKRRWVDSGIVEEFDERQARLLRLVVEKVRHYYKELYRTAPRYKYPLSISRLARLCKRSVGTVSQAVRILGNTAPAGRKEPELYYERGSSKRHHAKRPFRIFPNETEYRGEYPCA